MAFWGITLRTSLAYVTSCKPGPEMKLPSYSEVILGSPGLWNLGVSHARSGDHERAFILGEQALAVFAANPATQAPTALLTAAAMTASHIGHFHRAIEINEIVLETGLGMPRGGFDAMVASVARGRSSVVSRVLGRVLVGKHRNKLVDILKNIVLAHVAAGFLDSKDTVRLQRALGSFLVLHYSGKDGPTTLRECGVNVDALSASVGLLNISQAERQRVIKAAAGGLDPSSVFLVIAITSALDATLSLARTLIRVQFPETLRWIGDNCGVGSSLERHASESTIRMAEAGELIAACFAEQGLIRSSAAVGGLVFYNNADDASGIVQHKSAIHVAAALTGGSPSLLKDVLTLARAERSSVPLFASPTPLHSAASLGYAAIVKELIRYGLNAQQPDVWGRSAIDIACLQRWSARFFSVAFGSSSHQLCPRGVLAALHSRTESTVPSSNAKYYGGGWLQTTLKSPAIANDPLTSALLDKTCDIDVRDSLSSNEFVSEYLSIGKPVIVRGLQSGSIWDDIRGKWSRQNLTASYPGLVFRPAIIPYADQFGLRSNWSDMPLNSFLNYMSEVNRRQNEAADLRTSTPNLSSSTPLGYIFSKLDVGQTGLSSPNDDIKGSLLAIDHSAQLHRDMVIPDLFLPGKLGYNASISSYQFYVGPAGSGAPIHAHQNAFNVLVHGRKRWYIQPPQQTVYSRKPIIQWLQDNNIAHQRQHGKLLSCEQQAGDIVFVPDDWGHGVINLAESIGFAVEFNFKYAIHKQDVQL